MAITGQIQLLLSVFVGHQNVGYHGVGVINLLKESFGFSEEW